MFLENKSERVGVILIVTAYIGFLAADCILSTSPLVALRDFGFDDEYLVGEMLSKHGYFGANAYMKIYCCFFLIAVQIALPRSESVIICRCSSRQDYVNMEIRHILLYSITFMAIHQTASVLFICNVFRLTEEAYIKLAWSLAIDFGIGGLYFLCMSLIFIILRKILHRIVISVVIVVLINVVEYQLYPVVFVRFQEFLFPRSLSVPGAYFKGSCGLPEVVFTMILCVTKAVALCIIAGAVEEKRDVMQ